MSITPQDGAIKYFVFTIHDLLQIQESHNIYKVFSRALKLVGK